MTGKNLTIRVRTKKGMSRIHNLSGNNSFIDLKKAIAALADSNGASIRIMKGYPPVLLSASNETASLDSLLIQDGELLTIEESADSKSTATPSVLASSSNKLTTQNQNIIENKQPQTRAEVMERKVVPANNSCLFTSVYYVMENGTLNLGIWNK